MLVFSQLRTALTSTIFSTDEMMDNTHRQQMSIFIENGSLDSRFFQSNREYASLISRASVSANSQHMYRERNAPLSGTGHLIFEVLMAEWTKAYRNFGGLCRTTIAEKKIVKFQALWRFITLCRNCTIKCQQEGI